MKKKIICVSLIGLTLLGACESPASKQEPSKEKTEKKEMLERLETIGSDRVGSFITIFRDKETGCQYFNTDGSYGGIVIEPVLTAEGKPYCPQK